MELKIEDIKVGDRHRKDMGDIAALAKSIADRGLLHPVVVTPDNILIAGQRRLLAVQQLGWQTVPVHVVVVDDLLLGERDENEVRKNFTPTEAVAIGRLIEPIERELAKARQGTRTDKHPDKKSEGSTARARVGKMVGYSGSTYQRAKAIVEAAEADPKTYGDLVTVIDETRKVKPAYDELVSRKNGATPRPVLPPVKIGKRPATEGKFLNSVLQLASHATSLSHFDLSALSSEVRKEADKQLTEAIVALGHIRKSLRGLPA